MQTKISLKEFRIPCLIGCLNHERVEEQTVQVDLTLTRSGVPVLSHDRISDTWDYTLLAAQIRFLLKAGRFHLLETAAHFVARSLMLPRLHESFSAVSLDLSLTKFNIFEDTTCATVGLQVSAGEFQYPHEDQPWGILDKVAENQHLTLYRLSLGPDKKIDDLPQGITAELVLTPGLELICDAASTVKTAPLRPGDVFYWKPGQTHGYRNRNQTKASLLCINEHAGEKTHRQ